MGWVLERATNRDLVDLLSTEIWSKLGAEHDAYVIADLNNTPWVGGGINATLRDAARFGLMMLKEGNINGNQVVSKDFVKDIQRNAINTGYWGVSYRSQWWVNKNLGSFSAEGVSGQVIMIFPIHDLIIVKFSSWPSLSGYHDKGWMYDLRAYKAIINFLNKQ